MHYSIIPEEMKTEIEKVENAVTNIWNGKQYKTKLPLSMFFVQITGDVRFKRNHEENMPTSETGHFPCSNQRNLTHTTRSNMLK
jgi:hypothetical protein